MAKQKIVLAYSGGLDTSVILKWLKETYDAEIIAFTADIGQKEELDGLEEKALATGASKVYIDDLRDEFANDFIFPMFQAGAMYEGQYLLGTSIARPLIAKRMVDIARAEGATAIAHGATGKGNDQVRFELGVAGLAPDIEVIAPWRIEEFRNSFPGRAEMIAYAEAHGIPVTASAAKSYSMDRNLLHISYESGVLEDPWFDASAEDSKDMYLLSVSPEDAPDEAEYLELTFEQGNVVALNGESMSPLQVMEKLNELGGKHGIGRVDMVENRFVGMKSRGVYETPGGTILFTAHRKMESITMDREVMNLRDSLITRYSTLVYNGFWFAPERLALQALVTESQKNVTGTVRVKLYKGNVIGAGVKSPVSLYNPDIATMEADPTQAYDQGDATGFIRLNALRLKVATGVNQNQ
ncbi:argininosuccinate synthase [Paenibacillus lautus]|jgi:argininosuccinate synthase|uniref:Argininosuccinate synthase n=1 Tax=Paenibacillus lautus TaxID=1401 RepID=A0A385TEP4_PAELA|nr:MULTISPECIES: argininosuccinate synthase [Paenibacillus]VTR62420.1 argininosuccinate synthase [Actinobacillus pleuropneumoniae]ACX68053.1 argininosuccinate synthase [Paenibacillus sp. Y412MC10]AYB41891.1 argininosuccinate synthase [Paenibacillus lautus]ETT67804.1 argininosuccinate synthase [Paenibacillus sp. FSL H8-457]MCI1776652.1 argininosuccinate synthase [Paenibacillus lautus]